MLERATAWYWNRVESAVRNRSESLTVLRWILGLYLLLFDAPFYSWIDDAPRAFFEPPIFSPSNLAGRFPPSPFFLLLDIVAIVAICTMTIGYRTRTSTIVVLVTRVIGTTFAYSFGKISHQVILTVFLLCMAISNWGSGSSRSSGGTFNDSDDAPRRTVQSLAILATALAFGFVTAGIGKFRSWVTTDISQSGILSWYYPNLFTLGRSRLLASQVPGLPLVLLKIADCAAVLVEMSGFVGLMLGRVGWRVWLLLATFLHLSNVLFLNITFTTQVVIYLAFVDLSGLMTARIARFRPVAGVAVLIIGGWHVWARLVDRGSSIFLVSDPRVAWNVDLYVGLSIMIAVAVMLVNEIRRTWTSPASDVRIGVSPAS